MSLDWLLDIERAVNGGRDCFACPGVKSNHWIVSFNIENVRKEGKRTAALKRAAVNIVQLVPYRDALPDDMFLVPTKIGEGNPKDEVQVEWSTVATAEAAEMMRDMRRGEPPFFGMRIVEAVK